MKRRLVDTEVIKKMKWLEENAKFNDDTMWFELKKDATEEEKNIFEEYTLFFEKKRNESKVYPEI